MEKKTKYKADIKDPIKAELGDIIDVYDNEFFVGRARILMGPDEKIMFLQI